MQVYNIQRSKDLKELTLHGHQGFPVAVYTTIMKDNVLGYIPLHWHKEFQFVLVTEGQVQYTVESETFVLKTGQGVFINSNLLHTSASYKCDNSTLICFDIKPSLLQLNPYLDDKYIQLITSPNQFSYLKLIEEDGWQKDIVEHLKKMEVIYEKEDYSYELSFISHLLEILSLILRHVSPDRFVEKLAGHSNDRIKNMVTYIHNHYSEKVTLDDIAKAGNISRSECCRFFKKMTRLTPIEYLTNYRLNQSVYLLENIQLSITEIAVEVGFSSTSYFIHKFKQHIGYTPKEFQQSFIRSTQSKRDN